jgi:hypothetical protein
MKIMIKFIGAILFASVVLEGCGRTEPKGFYYGGEWDDPDEFYFEFKEGGKISICRGNLYERNCCADGSWQMSGNSIVISGISNFNCPEMVSLNGTFSSCDKPDCNPSGKAFKKGDITIWPDKE